ncbi:MULTISPECIES: UDP-4-amino-4,6-dideoxy-N-acetyl-beta-L-altrosamine transaminase [unclassified Lentimonas]|uniref:UDP-4-amino-4, 6-dideoxy-N-acetyl-beta-L-altrosamine transaminase n=1 Tax=unclassified Lentimonas TaxID=2630993 RepID=UPI001326403A|nr:MULTISPECIES: UDP-4-amino-4,6-dideoxy-N-acetyl-beta-L-altrosamine transaminase [unclassified Lentimonas]CAA6676536.1 Bacillosamine/Legionaminic acid biosynthesis aminotransferase PglE; 4-keto-6-deoxy-N-Acetyl-D-hexosaminyl-(Lipid carrier) aminotransferase [Lentimonas sp. CC4]CAA6685376.1 Bacillosamine/Legionaminic acid biosynthesis aminotransferase PglE; 4-keto-6-deoxy-N-Acetyl-D-hexosaminyl-(Lipid carrier) aminotransferase [Lentimonas sp. CC6]CAA7074900.1 Bacillosamine/Legionaminic acid bios
MNKRDFIPYGRQSIGDSDIAAVRSALESDFLTSGPEIEAFEGEFAEFVGAKHAVAVCNATAALHLAMLVTEIGPGDRVLTTPNTFLSSANCAAFVGATPDFCDIDPNTYNLCPKALAQAWKDDTKAVVAVAYAGQPCDMPAIAKIARSHGAVVIEDACHGTGGGFELDGQRYKTGGHPWADITTFSFHPVKTMTTGEGGILVTNNDAYAQAARKLRSHGITREAEHFSGLGSETPALQEQGPWYYEMQHLGYNYRITDLQCALGRSQLKKLPRFIERRREIVARYNAAFADLPWLQTPQVPSPQDSTHISWHLYSVQIDFTALNQTRTEVMQRLREQGIGSQVLYIPVYLQPYYRNTYGYKQGKCPIAESVYEKTLSLPLFPRMSDTDVETVIHRVRNLTS